MVCTCKKFTKFIIYEINKDNLINNLFIFSSYKIINLIL